MAQHTLGVPQHGRPNSLCLRLVGAQLLACCSTRGVCCLGCWRLHAALVGQTHVDILCPPPPPVDSAPPCRLFREGASRGAKCLSPLQGTASRQAGGRVGAGAGRRCALARLQKDRMQLH